MPNRIIKESIHTSEKISALTDAQFRLWVGLVTYVDDYGRGDARPAIIKGAVFPLRRCVTLREIEKGLQGLADADCVRLYKVDDKPYLYFPNWEAHQRIQTKRSKFPAPVSTVGDGEVPLESESKSKSEFESSRDNCTPSAAPRAAPLGEAENEAVFSLPLNDGSAYRIFEEQVNEWAKLYPAVDVISQLRAMKGWLDANPKRKKTKEGILRFANGWLAKEQDRGGAVSANGFGGRRGAANGRDGPAASVEIDKFMAWNSETLYGSVEPDEKERLEQSEAPIEKGGMDLCTASKGKSEQGLPVK